MAPVNRPFSMYDNFVLHSITSVYTI